MSLRKAAIIVGAVALLACAPSAARADWLVTPFLGPNFGGDTVDERLNYGVSIAGMGGGAFGFELDLGHSPNFFGRLPFGTYDNSRVTTLSANLIVGAPMGGQWGVGVRPYAAAGIGLVRMAVEGGPTANVIRNDAGFNLGAGLMGFMNDNVGLRGDLRYFRNFDQIEQLNIGHFNFWRGTVGVVLRWQ
jgi:opacity protein-like surface antigen